MAAIKALFISVNGDTQEVTVARNDVKSLYHWVYKGTNITGRDQFIESFNFGKPTDGQPNGCDSIYMCENGRARFERNARVPEFFGNLLLCGLDDDGELVDLHTPLGAILSEIRAAIARKAENHSKFMEWANSLAAEGKVDIIRM